MKDSIYEEKLKIYLRTNQIKADHLRFDRICHTVEEAAEAVGAKPEDFVKSICFISEGKLIVAVVKGEDKVDTGKLALHTGGKRPKPATAEEILHNTGYPCGGTPAFGYDALFLIDSRVLEKKSVYTGGGSQFSLVKINPEELKGKIADIRKEVISG